MFLALIAGVLGATVTGLGLGALVFFRDPLAKAGILSDSFTPPPRYRLGAWSQYKRDAKELTLGTLEHKRVETKASEATEGARTHLDRIRADRAADMMVRHQLAASEAERRQEPLVLLAATSYERPTLESYKETAASIFGQGSAGRREELESWSQAFDAAAANPTEIMTTAHRIRRGGRDLSWSAYTVLPTTSDPFGFTLSGNSSGDRS